MKLELSEQARETLSYHVKDAGYAAVGFLGAGGRVAGGIVVLGSLARVLVEREAIFNSEFPEFLGRIIAAGTIAILARQASAWAGKGNNKVWEEHLDAIDKRYGVLD